MTNVSTAELERRLERARSHREEEPAFFRCLLDAWVYAHVPLSDDHPRVRLVQFRHPDGFYVSVRPRHLPCRSDQAHSHAP